MIPRRRLSLRRAMRRFGLPERLLAILVLMAAIDFGSNAVLFDRASNFALRSDDAARIAENLVIASRALEAEEPADRPALAERLSSPRFSLAWKPRLAHGDDALPLDRLRAQVLDAAPELASGDPRFSLRSLASPGSVNGAMLLKDGSGVVFRTQASEAWTLNAGRLAVLLVPTPLLVVLAWVLFRATIRPLKALVSATGRVGAGPPEPLTERGPDEVRRLIRAFNRMQSRIYRQMLDRTQSMLAIGHDLRTPLARLRLRLDNAGLDREAQADMVHDIDEMMHLLASLQAYVEGEGRQIPAEPVDLAAMAMTLVDNAYDQGGDATYAGEVAAPCAGQPGGKRAALCRPRGSNGARRGRMGRSGGGRSRAGHSGGPAGRSDTAVRAPRRRTRARYPGHGAGPGHRQARDPGGRRHTDSGQSPRGTGRSRPGQRPCRHGSSAAQGWLSCRSATEIVPYSSDGTGQRHGLTTLDQAHRHSPWRIRYSRGGTSP